MIDRHLPGAAVVATAAVVLGACGGNGPKQDTSSASPSAAESSGLQESPTAVAPPPAPDGAPLKDCLLTPALDRGIYKNVSGQPDADIQQLADDAGADVFMVLRESRGLVYAFLLTAPAAAEALVPGLQPTLANIAAANSLPTPASGSQGPVAFGVLTITKDEPSNQLLADVGEDIGKCLQTTGLG